MKKAISIILTVLLIASIACNVHLFTTYKTTLNALSDAKSEMATITESLSEKKSDIAKANTKIADLETTITDLQTSIADLQKQNAEVKILADEKEKELEAIKESASYTIPSDTETPPKPSNGNGNSSQAQQPTVDDNVMINPYTGEVMGPDDHYTASDGAEVWGMRDSSDYGF